MRYIIALVTLLALALQGCGGQMRVSESTNQKRQNLGKGVWVYSYAPYGELIEEINRLTDGMSKSEPITMYWWEDGILNAKHEYCEFVIFDGAGKASGDTSITRTVEANGEYSYGHAYGASLSSKAVDVLADYWENGEVFRFIYYDIYLLAASDERIVILATIPVKPRKYTEDEVRSSTTLEKLKEQFLVLLGEEVIDISIPA